MVSVNLVNIPLGRFELSYKNGKFFEMKSDFQFFSFWLVFRFEFLQLLHTFTLKKFRFTFQYVICKSIIWTLLLRLGFTLHSLNYLHKIILAKKVVNKINEPCHYKVLCFQSASVKRSFTIFSVLLSHSREQHLRGYRKWGVSL